MRKLALSVLSSLFLGSLAVAGQGAKPHILLVHGAFADGSSWNKVTQILQKDGYVVEAVQNNMASLGGDIDHVKARIAAQKSPTVVVGHSYGGAVISGASADAPNAKALVYIAAFVLDQGQSLGDLLAGGKTTPALAEIYPDETGYLYLKTDGFVKYFANGVGKAEAMAMAVSQRPVNGASFGEKLAVKAGWHSLPSWYLVSDEDLVIPPQAEAFFAQTIGAKKTVHAKAGHAVMVSKPEIVAKLIEEAAEAVK